MKKGFRILSLDISGSSTGWSFLSSKAKVYKFGTIKTKNTMALAERLTLFRNELKDLIFKYKPEVILIEDTFVGRNPAVNKLLSKFGGVAEQLVYECLEVSPVIISNKTVKAFFCVKKKEQLFEVISSLLDWSDDCSFKEYNDMSDAIAQLMYFIDTEKYREIKKETSYGFIYK